MDRHLTSSGFRAQQQIARQEREIQRAESELARIARVHEQMLQKYEKALSEIERLREQVDGGANSLSSTTPPLGTAMPEGITSQYDKFLNRRANNRLQKIGQGATIKPASTTGLEAGQNQIHTGTTTGSTLQTGIPTTDRPIGASPTTVETVAMPPLSVENNANVPTYRAQDNDNHFTEVTNIPGIMYVSGRYMTDKGMSGKTYEYIPWPTAAPLKVGDIVKAPVHARGYHQGRHTKPGHDLDFVITDIYTAEKFKPYHDHIT